MGGGSDGVNVAAASVGSGRVGGINRVEGGWLAGKQAESISKTKTHPLSTRGEVKGKSLLVTRAITIIV